jgi:hypothetical protein
MGESSVAGQRQKTVSSIFDMPPSVAPQRIRRAQNLRKMTREFRESVRDLFDKTDHLVSRGERSQWYNSNVYLFMGTRPGKFSKAETESGCSRDKRSELASSEDNGKRSEESVSRIVEGFSAIG